MLIPKKNGRNYNFEGEVVQIIVQKDYKTTDLKIIHNNFFPKSIHSISISFQKNYVLYFHIFSEIFIPLYYLRCFSLFIVYQIRHSLGQVFIFTDSKQGDLGLFSRRTIVGIFGENISTGFNQKLHHFKMSISYMKILKINTVSAKI